MNIPQLLHKLWVIANVEIVVPCQSNVGILPASRFQRIGQRIPLWFAEEEEVNMLRYDYVAVNLKPVTAPHPLQGCLEDSAACIPGK
jgi:hypothetical protein